MKKITILFAVLITGIFHSCRGPEGPPGPPGYGVNIEAEVFEVTGSFTNQNGFEIFVPLNPAIFTSDHILIYRLNPYVTNIDIWQLLPQYYFFEDGTLDYAFNYDFTNVDIGIYMEGFDLGGLNPIIRMNQIFRVVILPGYFSNARMDFSDYNEVMNMLGLTETDIKKLEIR